MTQTSTNLEPTATPLEGASAPSSVPFVVSVRDFEGPLHLLLELAQKQKVDLAKISIAALAEQYIQFIEKTVKAHLDEAAEYLVMAAYLAYLKSRLLLPRDDDEEAEALPPEMQAAVLAWRLERLDAMRRVSEKLMARDRLGIQVLPRGAPEGIRLIRSPIWKDTLFDLLRAYVMHKLSGTVDKSYRPHRHKIFSVEDAYKVLSAQLGLQVDWQTLSQWLPKGHKVGGRSTLASAFAAMLIMAKDGLVELKQKTPFAPIYMRARKTQEGEDV